MNAGMIARRLTLSLSLLLTGVSSLAATEQPAPSCASSRAELKARDVTELFLKHKGQMDLKSQAGCLKLENGIELPAFLLELPAFKSPYSIRFEAPMGNGTYLLPRVDTLDAELKSVRIFPSERFKRRGIEMSLEVFLNPSNAAERYVLVYADPQHLGEQDLRTTSVSKTLFVGTGFYIAGDDKTVARHSVDEGKLTVSLVGEQWDRSSHDAQGHH
jgi:hypothetical protein